MYFAFIHYRRHQKKFLLPVIVSSSDIKKILRTSRSFTRIRHVGQVGLDFSHRSKHAAWKVWPQGTLEMSDPPSKWSVHITHWQRILFYKQKIKIVNAIINKNKDPFFSFLYRLIVTRVKYIVQGLLEHNPSEI